MTQLCGGFSTRYAGTGFARSGDAAKRLYKLGEVQRARRTLLPANQDPKFPTDPTL